jgi:hypothetical protein
MMPYLSHFSLLISKDLLSFNNLMLDGFEETGTRAFVLAWKEKIASLNFVIKNLFLRMRRRLKLCPGLHEVYI